MSETRESRAVFYDVDGTLVSTNILYVFIHYTLRQPKLTDRFRRLLQVLLLSPAYLVAERFNRTLFNRIFYANYRGMDYERLRLMGEEIARDVLLPHLYHDARGRIRRAREMGLKQVIVSGSLDFVLEPFAGELGIEHVIANRLEFVNGKATGKLAEPLVAQDNKRVLMEAFAREQGVDMGRSYAFSDSASDIQMLASVGFPVAVNPDSSLERKAREEGWAVSAFA